MTNTREQRAKLNILVTLLCQLMTMVCGVIVPKLIIDAFGSEAYGATTSITQFLSYITLLEGGIGGVARAALYRPLSENNINGVSLIMSEIKRFFSIIAYIFAAYVVVLACSFKYFSGIQCFDWLSTFWLVLVISIATFVQYFIGISYAILLHAAQKTYIINAISLGTTIANAFLVVILVNLDCSLIAVKFVSSLVFAIKPLIMWYYVKKRYNLVKCKERDPGVLKQKWTGLGQHIAYFLHYNTDVVVLTILSNLTLVAVYSVYNMIIYQMQHLTISFSAGMEALFGNMLAKREYKQLHKWFGYYETLLSAMTIILFSATAILIVPFVCLYTANVTDADYIQPIFAVVLVLSSAVYCLRMPYHSMTIAAGHFKQTRIAAYGEAGINIIMSIALVSKYGLVGVAIATLIATLFRLVYYVVYLSKNIIYRSIKLFIKRIFVNASTFVFIYFIGTMILKNVQINNYIQWTMLGFVVVVLATAVTVLLNVIFYRNDMVALWKSLTSRLH